MRKIRVYVDTSVFGGVEDDEFAGPSQRFFERVRRGEFLVLMSQLTWDELADAPAKVQNVVKALPGVVPTRADQEAMALAQAFIDAGVLGASSVSDALHVATATVAGADVILSWNFRHIVNFDRIHKYNAINVLRGFRPIEIHSPLEMFDVDENKEV
jgi:predicted nucleic acid-binding protein